MSKVFRVTPKRVKKTNGIVLTPEMEVTVTTQQHTTDPFYNGAKEIKDAYVYLSASNNEQVKLNVLCQKYLE